MVPPETAEVYVEGVLTGIALGPDSVATSFVAVFIRAIAETVCCCAPTPASVTVRVAVPVPAPVHVKVPAPFVLVCVTGVQLPGLSVVPTAGIVQTDVYGAVPPAAALKSEMGLFASE